VCVKDVPKAKQFLPFLQRAGKTEALVEFVASGSRLRLYIPKETCLITLLLSGSSCSVVTLTEVHNSVYSNRYVHTLTVMKILLVMHKNEKFA